MTNIVPAPSLDHLDEPASVAAAAASLDSQIRRLPRVAGGLVGAGILVGGWGATQFAASSDGLSELGEFLAGTVGSLWSLAGLILIYVAFLSQRRQLQLQEEELRLTRVDLRATREELKGQREALTEQSITGRRQQFDSMFFQLLRLHGEILAAVRITDAWGTYSGRQAFKRVYELLREQYQFSQGKVESPRKHAYQWIYDQFGSEIGHYFRNLYHIIKLVDQSALSDKERYSSFVRAQLSTNELLVLFYNCLSDYGVEKFKPLVEKYMLFKTLDSALLLDEDDRDRYHLSAYERVNPTNAQRAPTGAALRR